MADTEGTSGNDNISGTASDDNINGNGGDDSLQGRGGNDNIDGGSGNDNINGGSGNDTIYGGDGDDIITGGAGDDTIEGGKGNDTMTAGNSSPSDTFVIRDGDGNDTITDFDPGEPDIIRFDMAEITSFQDVVDRMRVDGNNTIITYDNGQTTRLLNVNMGDLTAANFEYIMTPACLVAGTFIATPDGLKKIETLAVGDLVTTLDYGAMPILEVLVQAVEFDTGNENHKPILIGQHALGENTPHASFEVSPQHRVLFTSPETCEQILVPAVKLTKRKGVRRKRGAKRVLYYNLLLADHNIIFANGCAVETLLVTAYTNARLTTFPVSKHHIGPARTISKRDRFYSGVSESHIYEQTPTAVFVT